MLWLTAGIAHTTESGAPIWTAALSGGLALLSLLVAALALLDARRARAHERARTGGDRGDNGRPSRSDNDQGYLITIQNVGAGDARRVGFIVVLSGHKVGGYAQWEGILRPGEEVNATPRLKKEHGSHGTIHGIAYGDDHRGVTYARPFASYARQRAFRSRNPFGRKHPPTAETMFAACYPHVPLPSTADSIGLELEDPIPQGQRTRLLKFEA
jgi:hypothetical protein